ncbi:MAG: ribosome biogenesis factor YjgA [Humidesulfovibrio sp.]|uniref:ribosome biogenesis factor YjgA n=1 Tax=Humidesulfovibrio sp. TaxID=2910988 RepID=UPI0027ED44C9|nr:ribosome biogenesis factor YjgA [Humidesulfovibrio sp.]MDQ7834132.1 ribosome biogenesis factor YjgA [Humidesulfovibrio sp.]
MRKPKPYDHSDPRPPSRSQKKRDSAALQVLGGKLAELPESALKRLDLAPRLMEAIMDYKGLAKHEAKRRQLQFIGALMRETDSDPLARAVEDMESGNRTQAREFHAVEAWRTALLSGDESGLEAIVALAPEAEQVEVRSKIRQLVRNARTEAEKNKPPRSSRTLFRLLRELRQSGQGDLPESLPGEDIDDEGQGGHPDDQADFDNETELSSDEAQDGLARKTTF